MMAQVSFPPSWTVIPTQGDLSRRVTHLTSELVDEEQRSAMELALTPLLRAFERAGVDALATFVHSEPEHNAVAVAACAIATEPVVTMSLVALEDLVRSGPHESSEPLVVHIDAPGGPLVRSTLVRDARELTTESGSPTMAVARYAFPVDANRALLLHFETLSVAYLDEFLAMFDAIGRSAKPSPEPGTWPHPAAGRPNGTKPSSTAWK